MPSAVPPPVSLSIRIDDIFNRGHPARPRSLTPVLDLVESHGFRLILNVIPRRLIESPNQGGAMVRELSAALARGHEIIQHGYDHCCRQCGESSHQTYCPRFDRQQDIEQMRGDILRGKEMLEAAIGQPIYVYGPTGSDPHTTALLQVVKRLGYLAITGETTPDNEILDLPALGGGNDYFFGLTTAAEFEVACKQLMDEFEQCPVEPGTGNKRFHILLHDPGIRANYCEGLTLQYLNRTLHEIRRRAGSAVRSFLSRDVLGISAESLQFKDPPAR